MLISVFDLFKIGIGPSSSHTVGPMLAAQRFLQNLPDLKSVSKVQVELCGSLGATGRGHGSDKAIILGLLGEHPETVAIHSIEERIAQIQESASISLLGQHSIRFLADEHIILTHKALPGHPNAMRFQAWSASELIATQLFYSVGGGFVLDEEELAAGAAIMPSQEAAVYEFHNAETLLAHCEVQSMSMSDIMYANELSMRTRAEIDQQLDALWGCMEACISRGCETEGVLPGFLKVKRRAAALYKDLSAGAEFSQADPLIGIDWINCYALAVNEENAAGGRVVTAPTNGAAGIIPAVMRYYQRTHPRAAADWHRRFLLTAAAIGILYKENASISGADVGCQGEVGVACSMAAAALAELLGATPKQVENAAEIGMEHNLGLTCDPVGGLVQVPCIERNAMAAVKAVNAARMALRGDGSHYVSLDKVIKTMRDTGADMKKKYKETARGGLAVNVTEC